MSVRATYRTEAKLSDTVDQFFDEELTDFDAVSPAWDAEADQVEDFDAVTDPDGDLNNGVSQMEVTFDDANEAHGTMNMDAVDQTSAVVSFWFDPNDVAIDDTKRITIGQLYNGAGLQIVRIWCYFVDGVHKLRIYANEDVGGTPSAYVEIPEAYSKIDLFWKQSSGADDGFALLYLNDALIISLTGLDNDSKDVDYGRFGMVETNSVAFGGSFYLARIKIDPIGGPMIDTLAAKNGSWGLSIPIMDTTFRRVEFTNPTAETAIFAETWFNPSLLEMAEGDGFIIMSAEQDTEWEIVLRYTSGEYTIALNAREDVGGTITSYYPIIDGWNHIRMYWRASQEAGADNGSAALYIGHVLQESLTGLDNDTITVSRVKFGAIADLDDTTYGIFYMDDCGWGPWIDITSAVIGDITGSWGMVDNNPLDLLADTGAMRIILNNEDGEYLPGLSGALDGFKKGTPIRLRFNYSDLDYIRFYGTIDDINPEPSALTARRVTVEVTDWMDYAATHPMVNPGLGTDQRADEMITTIVADMPIAPLATDYDEGINTFPTAFDNVTTKTKAYTEINKTILSEMGYCYLIKDPVHGETLVFENAEARNGLRTPDFSSDNTMTSIEVEHGENVINRFINKVYPRRVDAAPVVLFETGARQRIPSGQTIVFRGNYTDPDGGGAEVSGINMITPVITTDYIARGNQDGSGGTYTADLTVGVDKGTEGTTFTLTNGAATTVWVWIRIRGDGVYAYNPIEHSAEDSTSIDEYGYLSLILHQKYMDEISWGALVGAVIVEQEKQPRTRIDKVHFVANRTNALMLAWLTWDVGNMCYLKEDTRGINEYAYIQGVAFTISPGGLVRFAWVVKGMLSLLLGLSLIGCEFDPGTTDGLNFGHLPQITDHAALDRSFSMWIYPQDQINDTPNALVATYDDGSGLYIGMSDEHGDDTSCIKYYQKGETGPGIWVTAIDTVPQNQWVHVVVTRDASVAANAPNIYIDAVDMALTNPSAQVGVTSPEIGANFFIGNVKTATIDWDWPFDGVIKDVRVFNTILTQAEVTTLEGGGDVDDGLVFQAPCVRTKDLDYFEDRTLTAVDRMIDNMYGCVGVPNNSVITRLIP